MITLTDSAIQQLKALVLNAGDPDKALRILVESGGCAGMQYGMRLDDVHTNDIVTERNGGKVVIDPSSATYLKGSTLDYEDQLAGSGFRLHNPNAARSCGCGTSFESKSADSGSTAQSQS